MVPATTLPTACPCPFPWGFLSPSALLHWAGSPGGGADSSSDCISDCISNCISGCGVLPALAGALCQGSFLERQSSFSHGAAAQLNSSPITDPKMPSLLPWQALAAHIHSPHPSERWLRRFLPPSRTLSPRTLVIPPSDPWLTSLAEGTQPWPHLNFPPFFSQPFCAG